MKTHILAGDALAGDFREAGIEGDVIVCRECLVAGDVDSQSLPEFWSARAKFITAAYSEDGIKYFEDVVSEFEKIFNISSSDEIYLWFEYDLFCQVNMWFVLHLINQKGLTEVYRVAPVTRNETDLWKGFGRMTADDLRKCFDARVKFSKEDIELGVNLWLAYQKEDLERLESLSNTQSECFPYLKEVCTAEIERKRDRRPQKTLEKITANGITDFKEIFAAFAAEEGVYGFGDSQVKAMYESAK